MVSQTSIQPEQRRWLMKALREAGGELYQQFYRLDEKSLRWRPGKGDWCMKEIAAHIRDAEALYLAQIEAITQRRNPRLPHEPIECYPQERDYRSQPLQNFLSEWEQAREETCWLLRMLEGEDWLRTGTHPYKGVISIHDIVRELHDHDLEYLRNARRLREAIEAR
jgi:hypothetical protein